MLRRALTRHSTMFRQTLTSRMVTKGARPGSKLKSESLPSWLCCLLWRPPSSVACDPDRPLWSQGSLGHDTSAPRFPCPCDLCRARHRGTCQPPRPSRPSSDAKPISPKPAFRPSSDRPASAMQTIEHEVIFSRLRRGIGTSDPLEYQTLKYAGALVDNQLLISAPINCLQIRTSGGSG